MLSAGSRAIDQISARSAPRPKFPSICPVSPQRVESDVEGNPNTSTASLPLRAHNGFVLVHQREDASDDLLQHGAEVGRRVLGVVELSSQETLADAKTLRQSDRCHPDIDSKTSDVGLPVIPFEVPGEQSRGDSELTADGLADAVAVERACQWIHDAVRDGPVVLVAVVVGSNEIIVPRQQSVAAAGRTTRV